MKKELTNAGCITYGTKRQRGHHAGFEASVDCGVIYCTDAFSAGLTIVDYATADMCGQVIYPRSSDEYQQKQRRQRRRSWIILGQMSVRLCLKKSVSAKQHKTSISETAHG